MVVVVCWVRRCGDGSGGGLWWMAVMAVVGVDGGLLPPVRSEWHSTPRLGVGLQFVGYCGDESLCARALSQGFPIPGTRDLKLHDSHTLLAGPALFLSSSMMTMKLTTSTTSTTTQYRYPQLKQTIFEIFALGVIIHTNNDEVRRYFLLR